MPTKAINKRHKN